MKFIVERTSDDKGINTSFDEELGSVTIGHEKYPLKRRIIEFNTLEELLDFVTKYGKIVIHKYKISEVPEYIRLEVYDDFRE